MRIVRQGAIKMSYISRDSGFWSEDCKPQIPDQIPNPTHFLFCKVLLEHGNGQ